MSPTPPKPRLALRIGVTGARAIAPKALPAIRAHVAQVLARVRAELATLADDARAAAVYLPEPPLLRIVSPLAEGGDRVVAEEGLRVGAQLYAPLPFTQGEYEADFPDSITAFRALLARAEVLELDGARGIHATDSYVEIGHFTVRSCDLLIAIWDGQPERGRGGTAEIVRYAVRSKLPLWWIDTSGTQPPRLIASTVHLNHPDNAPSGEAAWQGLADYLQHTLLPPKLKQREHIGLFGRAVARFEPRRTAGPLEDYLAEAELPKNPLWRVHARLIGLLAPPQEAASLRPAPPASNDYWQPKFAAADNLSLACGERYRSSYVLVVALAIAWLTCVGLSGEVRLALLPLVIAADIAAIIGMLGLVLANLLQRWHERWISYRLLAELCRKQQVLAMLGRTLPVADVLRLSLEGGAGAGGALPREAWIAWYFAACLRASPFPTGSMAALSLRARAQVQALMAEQGAYHTARRARSALAGHRLTLLAEGCFALAAVTGLVKLFSLWDGAPGLLHWGGFFSVLVSGASGAFVGIRAYSEFSQLATQSARMLLVLKAADTELQAIPLDQPLISRDLGRAISALATGMMQDISGWAQLFRVKTLEAG